MIYNAPHRPAADRTLPDELQQMYQLRQHLAAIGPSFKTWFISGDTEAESLVYEVFDDAGPTSAATAILVNEQPDPKLRAYGIWNGQEGKEGASMNMLYSQLGNTSMFTFDTLSLSLADLDKAASVVAKVVELWRPTYVSVADHRYEPFKVFQDRPGVGWMIYLPRVITAEQVPEARKVVPVLVDKQQVGTILVSVADGRFDFKNPDHVAAANAIEVRLVDQDLLPLFEEL